MEALETVHPGGSHSGCQLVPPSEVTNRLWLPTETRPALGDQKSVPEAPPATGCKRACQLSPPLTVRTSSPLSTAKPTRPLMKSRSSAVEFVPSLLTQEWPPSLEVMIPSAPAATAKRGLTI